MQCGGILKVGAQMMAQLCGMVRIFRVVWPGTRELHKTHTVANHALMTFSVAYGSAQNG